MLVMPTLFESVSIPVYEAFALEVPVVASNVTALPEQIGDAGLLFDPLDPDALAAAIAQVLRDEGLSRALAAKGVVRIRGFDPSAYAMRLTQVVAELIA
ncbi:D-inositol-3-phosphate glycosyltransferase [compost metagenome]